MAEPTATSDTPPPPGKRRRLLLLLTLLFAVVGAAAFLRWYFVGQYRAITDDAYVAGNVVQITPQVEGTVIAIHADETDAVRQGQVMVQLDDTSARAALAEAKAALADAVRKTAELFAHAAQLRAMIDERRASLALAEDALKRRGELGSRKLIAEEDIKRAQLSVESSRASLAAAERELDATLTLTRNTSIECYPEVLRAEAAFTDAYLAWRRTTLPSPVEGSVAKRSVQLGQRVKPGDKLLAVVPLTQLWVDANFKEDQLGVLRLDQPVTLTADLYGDGVVYNGRVRGIGAGTGASFALLPPQNASGNWIKIVQRVPVRIALDGSELRDHPLRLGLSMRVTVDTHDRSGAVLAREAAPTAQVTNVYIVPDQEIAQLVDEIVRANLPKASGAAAREGR